MKEIQQAVERARARSPNRFVDGRADLVRDLGMYVMRENGHALALIAKAAGIKRAPTAGMALKRFEQRVNANKALRKTLELVTISLQ